jgi:hypothetical protein
MSVRIGSPDPFPVVVGVYVCRCGRTTDQHGLHAGEAPPGWVPYRYEGETEHACPDCAPAVGASAKT